MFKVDSKIFHVTDHCINVSATTARSVISEFSDIFEESTHMIVEVIGFLFVLFEFNAEVRKGTNVIVFDHLMDVF